MICSSEMFRVGAFLCLISSLFLRLDGRIIRVPGSDQVHFSTPSAVRAFNEGVNGPLVGTGNHGVKLLDVGEDGCKFYPEIVLVQDISSSYEDDMVNLARLIPELFEHLLAEYEGNFRFSIVSFTDKPGFSGSGSADFCAKVDLPLMTVRTAEDATKAQDTFNRLRVGGGGDWLEGAGEAMLRAAMSSSVGWTQHTHDLVTGRPILRLLVVATDAAVHEAVWHAEKAGANLPPLDIAANHDSLDAAINFACPNYDYPTPDEIRYAFKKRGVTPIIFSGVNYWWAVSNSGASVRRMWTQFRDLITHFGETGGPWADFDTGLAAYYADFLQKRIQMDGIVEIIDNTSSNFVEVFKSAMDQVTDLTCLEPTPSPTPVPQTTDFTEPHVGSRPADPVTEGAASSTGTPLAATADHSGVSTHPHPAGSTAPLLATSSSALPATSTLAQPIVTTPTPGAVWTPGHSSASATALLGVATTIPETSTKAQGADSTLVSEALSTQFSSTAFTSAGSGTSSQGEASTTSYAGVSTDGFSSEAASTASTQNLPSTSWISVPGGIAGEGTTTTVSVPGGIASNPAGEGTTTTVSVPGGIASNPVGQGTTTAAEESGGGAGIIIGSAAGGAAVAAAAAGVLLAKKLGLAGFGGGSPVDNDLIQDVENVEVTEDREQFEQVTGDLFS